MFSTIVLSVLSFTLVLRDIFYYRYRSSTSTNEKLNIIKYLNNVLEPKNFFRPLIVIPILQNDNIYIKWMNYVTYIIYFEIILLLVGFLLY